MESSLVPKQLQSKIAIFVDKIISSITIVHVLFFILFWIFSMIVLYFFVLYICKNYKIVHKQENEEK